MKIARLFTLLILILTLSLLVFSGCKETDQVTSVALKDYAPDSTIEMKIGEFDYSAYKILVSYESGKTEELKLTEEMIPEADTVKFYQVGEHDIKISYSGCDASFKIFVKRLSFENVSFSENKTFTYDGNPHSLELVGDVPANASVTFPGGNSFVNAGIYDVNAVISCEGYVTLRLSSTIKIERAKYDMSGVKLESKEVVFDGAPHTIKITGTLPQGVLTPTYTLDGKEVSSATEVGVYTIKASFGTTNLNYEPVSDMVATLTITPAKYDLTGIDIAFKDEDSKVLSDFEKTYDGKRVNFEINDKSKVGSQYFVSYRVLDEKGNALTDENGVTISTFADAGIYTVEMKISLIDEKNYQEPDLITRSFEIKKAKYDLSKIYFDSALVTYTGKAHKITVTLPTGHDVLPSDVVYEYRLGDKLLDVDSDVGVLDAGVYTVKAIFPDKNSNYEKLADLEATLQIEKQTIITSLMGFSGKTLVEYSGEEYAPTFKTWKEAIESELDVLNYGAIEYFKLVGSEYVKMPENEISEDSGLYRCSVKAAIADEYKKNYTFGESAPEIVFSMNYEIYKKEIEVPGVNFTSEATSIYNSLPKEIGFEILNITDDSSFSTEYFRNVNGEFVSLGDAIPTDAGFYKFIVSFTVNDATNYAFAGSGESVAYYFDFEIQKVVIETPAVSFNSEISSVYSGEAREIDFSYVADEEKVNVGTKYFEFVSGAFVALENGALPKNAGAYKFIVTISIEDAANYVFASGNSSEDFSFAFEIEKQVIDLNPYFSYYSNRVDYQYTGEDFRQKAIEAIPAEIKWLFDITPTDVYADYSYGSNWQDSSYDASQRASYYVKYYVVLKDKVNYTLSYVNMFGTPIIAGAIQVDHYFNIV